MKRCLVRLALATFLVVMVVFPGYAQGGGTSSSLVGTVVDQSGAVVPGAEVMAKNDATGAEYKSVTNENGIFTIPFLSPGIYTATVSVPNFKKAEVKNITLVAGTPYSLNKISLQVGGSNEVVTVVSGMENVQTQSGTIETTMVIQQIANLPLATRNVIDFLVMLPGVNTTGSARNSTISGMPNSGLNITIDGVNTLENYNKGDVLGFYSYIFPRLDAIQEVTVSTATPGAESSGTGAVQIKFVTRSGNNEYRGSGYWYHRNPALNSNYWFNNRDLAPVYQGDPGGGVKCTPEQIAKEFDKCKAPRDRVLLNQPGFRFGGPITLPKFLFGPLGFDGRNKAFFFVNYEEFRQPDQQTRSRSLQSPLVEQGNYVFLKIGTGGQPNEVRSVMLLGPDGLAAKFGQVSTWDPTVQKLYADIRNSTTCSSCTLQSYPIVTDPATQTLYFKNNTVHINKFPTARFDFNLTSRHHLEASWNYSYWDYSVDMFNGRDPQYPGFPVYGTNGGNRFSTSVAMRSTLTSRLVNEGRVGIRGGGMLWASNVNESLFSGPVANYDGFRFTPSYTVAAYSQPIQLRRTTPVTMFEDTMFWNKGLHSISYGGSWMDVGSWRYTRTILPSVAFGLPSAYDPAYAMFDSSNGTKNFPGATTSQISSAAALYAAMTGRITTISATAYLNEDTNQYEYMGPYTQRAHQREMGFFAQDAWRVRQELTLNYGVRWEFQRPWVPLNGSYSWATTAEVWGPSGYNSLFKPGASGGVPTQLYKYNPGDPAYHQDNKAIAPSVGFAWSPQPKGGLLGKILGEGSKTVLRGGFSVAYNRASMALYDGCFSSNPGGSITASRSEALGNLIPAGQTYPLLMRNKSLLGPPPFEKEPSYPLTPSIASQVRTFSPDIRTPYTISWSFGLQREITRDTAIEVRYVGNKSLQGITSYNLNEFNIHENGWLDEFWLAQKNLYANLAAGRGTNFRYYGPGTGTFPLPITIAYLGGTLNPNDPANYTTAKLGTSQGGFFTNATYNNYLNTYNANAGALASSLDGDANLRANAKAAGLPDNFFMVNPYLRGGAYIYQNGGWSKYDGMQVEIRRRISKGVMVNANYTFAKSFSSSMLSFRRSRVTDLGDTLPHAFKGTWLYELPIGSGRLLLSHSHGWLDRIIGSWEFHGTTRIQCCNLLDLGNVRLVGMTDEELRNSVGLRFDDANKRIYYIPQDILDQSYKAYSYTASGFTYGPPTGRFVAPANSGGCYQTVAGDCAPLHHYFRGPGFMRFDLSLVKRIRFSETKNFELRGEFLNAFNNINFYGVSSVGGLSSGQVTSAYRDADEQQDPGGRLIQIVMRINF